MIQHFSQIDNQFFILYWKISKVLRNRIFQSISICILGQIEEGTTKTLLFHSLIQICFSSQIVWNLNNIFHCGINSFCQIIAFLFRLNMLHDSCHLVRHYLKHWLIKKIFTCGKKFTQCIVRSLTIKWPKRKRLHHSRSYKAWVNVVVQIYRLAFRCLITVEKRNCLRPPRISMSNMRVFSVKLIDELTHFWAYQSKVFKQKMKKFFNKKKLINSIGSSIMLM